MRIHLHCSGLTLAPEERDHFERRLHFALGRFAPRLRHVAVRLIDENAGRGGVDKQCRVTARVTGLEQVVLEDRDENLKTLVDRVCNRLSRVIGRQLERAQFARSRTPYGETSPPDGLTYSVRQAMPQRRTEK